MSVMVSVPCHKWVWLNWYLSTLGWRWNASITAISCCLSRCFQQSNVSQNVVYSQNNDVAYGEIGHFLCSVISQGKVFALDRWGGKWNQLSMTPRLTTNCAKNYCNRTLIVKVIVENVVTCFFSGHGVYRKLLYLTWDLSFSCPCLVVGWLVFTIAGFFHCFKVLPDCCSSPTSFATLSYCNTMKAHFVQQANASVNKLCSMNVECRIV